MRLGSHELGPDHPVYIIGEIGINHNGDLGLAFELIRTAKRCGLDCVKFQKRTIEDVYPPDVLARPREGPFGDTYGDEKYGLEFEEHEYNEIDKLCKELGIDWTASAWDDKSVEFLASYEVPFLKVPSACAFNTGLLDTFNATELPVILSTGLCELDDIDRAVEHLDRSRLAIAHCVSAYPTPNDELNLRAIASMQERYGLPIGYSGHETGILPAAIAVALGACFVERHITMDRAMYGSDHAASIEPVGMEKLTRYIRSAEEALGDGRKRRMPCEDIAKFIGMINKGGG